MGASEFWDVVSGSTVKEAFAKATEDARYDFGHGGYTGTIAEKHEYKAASSEVFKSKEDAESFVSKKMDDDEHWCQDKWGPAAYVSFKDKDNKTKFIFFGWASS